MLKTKRKGKRPYKKWTDENYIKIYELAKSGMHNRGIALSLGVERQSFSYWLKTKPALVDVLKRAREGRDEGKSVGSFMKFVYGRLPPELKKVWQDIHTHKVDPEIALSTTSKKLKQQLFLYALVACNFSHSKACQTLAIPKMALQQWQRTDTGFNDLVKGIHECKKDFFEGALIKLVKQGDTSAILFANRTINRDRGYNDKVEVNFNATVQHKHSLDDLPLELRKQLLTHIRQQKVLPAPDDVEEAEYEEVKK